MITPKKMLCIFVCFLMTFLGCKDDAEAKNDIFELNSKDLIQQVDKSSTQIEIPINTTLNINDWTVQCDARWINISKSKDKILLSIYENQSEARNASVVVNSSLNKYIIKVTQFGLNDVVVDEDIQVKPYGGKDSEHQDGQSIVNTFDGKFSVTGGQPFHTPWGKVADFPVTLEYYFNGKETIDYFVYYTRSGNGNFGKVKVYYTTDPQRNNYILQGEYNFYEKNAPSKIDFKESLNFTGVKFEVLSGSGGFVSCDEMQFFRINPTKTLNNKLLNVFTDLTCSELRADATVEKIKNLPSSYFIRIAEALKNNTYNEWEKNFRVRSYQPYSDVAVWSDKLMTKTYSDLDNPTGVSVSKGDEIIVLVGDTYGQNISLQCIWETGSEYKQTAASGKVYLLKEGANKFVMEQEGQLFVMYNTDITAATAKPIKIHIPLGSGTVTGFFDLKEHKTDAKYSELLHKATHKYFCVRGDKIMFYFHRSKLLQYVPNSILSAINLWDDIIGWQQELMGIEDVRPNKMNNHLFAISPEGSYMWASNYQIGFVYTYLGNILLKDNVMSAEDNAWGPAHEIGHIHQGAINWASSSESSNNLFSNYIIYKLGKYKSRGNGLYRLADARFVNKQAWYNMGSATHQNEDTETHMRMNWQLWNYYHRCGFKKDFWPTLFKLMREQENRVSDSNPGKRQLTFAMMACKAAGQNLEDFFDLWGFFEPVNTMIDQYGSYNYVVTSNMIEEARNFMRKYPKAAPIEYLEDRKKNEFPVSDYRYKEVGDVGYYTQFKDNQKITKMVTYSKSGRTITIHDGDEAVAFEVKQGNKLMFFSNQLTFEVPLSIPLELAQIYAVQADGVRKLISLK